METFIQIIQGNKSMATGLIILAVIAAIGFGYSKFTGQDDSAVEEISEEIIKLKTGVDVDLTPGSPEKKGE